MHEKALVAVSQEPSTPIQCQIREEHMKTWGGGSSADYPSNIPSSTAATQPCYSQPDKVHPLNSTSLPTVSSFGPVLLQS